VTLEGREGQACSRIVFIVRNMTRETVAGLFAAIGAIAQPAR
jgi:hypothetical protein